MSLREFVEGDADTMLGRPENSIIPANNHNEMRRCEEREKAKLPFRAEFRAEAVSISHLE